MFPVDVRRKYDHALKVFGFKNWFGQAQNIFDITNWQIAPLCIDKKSISKFGKTMIFWSWSKSVMEGQDDSFFKCIFLCVFFVTTSHTPSTKIIFWLLVLLTIPHREITLVKNISFILFCMIFSVICFEPVIAWTCSYS